MAVRLHITGASGSGTTTLGRSLAEELAGRFFDADDYYWVPGTPRFQQKRDVPTRLSLLLRDLGTSDATGLSDQGTVDVISGSIMNWGAELEDSFALIVFLTVPAQIRISRLQAREIQRFGSADPKFLAWAAQYDQGAMDGRSRARHECWLSRRTCPVLRIDGAVSNDDRLALVRATLSKLSDRL